MDYVQFCGIANPTNILSPSERISALEYAEQRKNISLSGKQHQIIDVREKVQFDLCHLFGSINIPFSQITALPRPSQPGIQSNSGVVVQLQQMRSRLQASPSDPVYVVCRLGNDSQIAVKKFKELGLDNGGRTWVGDIRGGLRAWREDVDRSFPEY
jgi:adenylyltransferase/sulfurtransferase